MSGVLSAQRDSGFRMRKRAHDLSYGLDPDDDDDDDDEDGDDGEGGSGYGETEEDEYAYGGGGGGGAADPFAEAQEALANAMDMAGEFNLPGTPDGPSRTVDPSPRARKLAAQSGGGGGGEGATTGGEDDDDEGGEDSEEITEENTEEAEARAWAEMDDE